MNHSRFRRGGKTAGAGAPKTASWLQVVERRGFLTRAGAVRLAMHGREQLSTSHTKLQPENNSKPHSMHKNAAKHKCNSYKAYMHACCCFLPAPIFSMLADCLQV
eukprot:GHRR01031673.1.p1 GENE.GHRR01031673.1~~GHRR01031673.1.p1  ORF type:complete len:105 (+),score=16.87 GHRR01031673.1:195-509(+)